MCLAKVRPWMTGVVVARGRVIGTVSPGLHLVLPRRRLLKVDMRPHVLDVVSQALPTSDGGLVDYRYMVRYRVVDAELAAMPKVRLHDDLERYMTDDPGANIRDLPTVIGYSCHYALRGITGSRPRAECLKREPTATLLLEGMRGIFEGTGVSVEEVTMTDAYPTNKGVREGVAAITFRVVLDDGRTAILPIGMVDVHPAGLRR